LHGSRLAYRHVPLLGRQEGKPSFLEGEPQLRFRRAMRAMAVGLIVPYGATGNAGAFGKVALGPIEETPRRTTQSWRQNLRPHDLTLGKILPILISIDHIVHYSRHFQMAWNQAPEPQQKGETGLG
jgi:hypothetical protein